MAPEVGMYYYKARIYSPTLGRFMQTDPIGYGDGVNWYDYVGGDPVNGRDPSGMVADPCSGAEICSKGKREPLRSNNTTPIKAVPFDRNSLPYTTARDADEDYAECKEGSPSDSCTIFAVANPQVKVIFQPAMRAIRFVQANFYPSPSDACGSTGTSAFPDKLGGVDISGACYAHDQCYSSSNTKGQCDRDLLVAIIKECSRQNGKGGCYFGALVYYMGLSAFGGPAYRNAQRK